MFFLVLFLFSLVCLLNMQQDLKKIQYGPIKKPPSCWAIKMFFFCCCCCCFLCFFSQPPKKGSGGGGGGVLDRVFVLYVLYLFSSHSFHCIYNKDENNSILRLFCIPLCYRIASVKTLGWENREIFLKLCACLAYLVDVCLVRYLTYYIYFALFSLLICPVSNCAHTVGWLLLKFSAIGIGFNEAETNCEVAHILGILLMNSYAIKICSEATFIWSLSPLNYVSQKHLPNYKRFIVTL